MEATIRREYKTMYGVGLAAQCRLCADAWDHFGGCRCKLCKQAWALIGTKDEHGPFSLKELKKESESMALDGTCADWLK